MRYVPLSDIQKVAKSHAAISKIPKGEFRDLAINAFCLGFQEAISLSLKRQHEDLIASRPDTAQPPPGEG